MRPSSRRSKLSPEEQNREYAVLNYLEPGESAKLTANNEYQFQLEHATLVSAQVPELGDLAGLTSQVAANNAYSVTPSASDLAVMSFLRSKIQHIIYVVKENRTFDQILGDLGNGSNGELRIQPSGIVSMNAEGGTFSNAQCFTSLATVSFPINSST